MRADVQLDPPTSRFSNGLSLAAQAPTSAKLHNRPWLTAALLLVTLALTTLFVTHGIRTGEFSINVDETVHACSGLFFASFLHDMPLRHPLHYTFAYYAHYPTLGLVEYPPVFYMAEGVMFRLFGPSVVTARVTVLLFALLGAYFLFRLVAYLADVWTAAACTLLVSMLPSVLLYEKSNMLDLPAMALGVAAAYYWIRYLREERRSFLYGFCAFAVLELLTKQQSIYLLLWCLLTLAVARKWQLLFNKPTMVAVGVCGAILFPYYLYTIRATLPIVVANVAHGNITQSHPYVYYLIQLPQQLGWPLLILSILGIASSYWWGKREDTVPMLLWIVACFVTETAMSNKVPRYIIYWLPPLVYFAIAPLSFKGSPKWVRAGYAVITAGLLAYGGITAWSFQRPYVSGYQLLAQRLVAEKQGIVLADVKLPGDLAFFVRGSDPQEKFIIDRKVLFVTRNLKKYGAVELTRSAADVQNAIRHNGIKYVAVEEGMPLRFESQKELRNLLQTPQYKLMAEFPVVTNDPEYVGHRLLLYENLQAVAPSTDVYRVPMLTWGDDITVPMSTMVGDGKSSANPEKQSGKSQ